jgi:hypothetical protein
MNEIIDGLIQGGYAEYNKIDSEEDQEKETSEIDMTQGI